jgi:flagellar basal body rod protein FlgC
MTERGSNVDLVDEAVTRLTASRAYEANLVSLQAQFDIGRSLLDL